LTLCEFSLPSAIDQLQTLKSLRMTNKRLYESMLKNAAALQTIGMHKGIYKASR